MVKVRLLRITTVPISLHLLLHGQLEFMQSQGFEVLTVSANGPEVDILLKKGIPHQVVPFSRKITPIRDLICVFKLINIMLRFRPNIVHTHTPKAGLLGMMAALITRIPIRMHTIAGLPLTEARGLKKKILGFSEKVTYGSATSIYPNSKGLRDYILQEFNVNKSKFRVIGRGSTNGIDIEYFKQSAELGVLAAKIREQYSINKLDYVYCFVGRVVIDKGIIELVRAFDLVSKNNGNIWLFLVGQFEEELSPLPSDIKLRIQNNKKIIHCGFQTDVRPWIIASNAFVFPSYREGFPNAVLQAGSLERPSIVSNINGCNEIIEDGRTGLIVRPKDVVSLSEAMFFLLKNKDAGVQMGMQSRYFIAKHFAQSSIWNGLVSEYKRQAAICT
ncbi:MAG: glycosyltransferase family 4 protein [Cyclobacteriaceae bacterium]